MKGTRVDFDPPIDPDVLCHNCDEWLVVAYMVRDRFGAGSVSYQWVHRDTGKAECVIVRHAQPYRPMATEDKVAGLIEARQAGLDAAETALRAALED